MKKEYGGRAIVKLLWRGGVKGFSLVEILVALSIFFIIASAFLALYTKSFLDIVYSGDKNKALYKAQEELESLIQSGELYGMDEIEIKFPALDRSIRIKGKIEQRNIQQREENVTITVFIPNRQ